LWQNKVEISENKNIKLKLFGEINQRNISAGSVQIYFIIYILYNQSGLVSYLFRIKLIFNEINVRL